MKCDITFLQNYKEICENKNKLQKICDDIGVAIKCVCFKNCYVTA